MSLPNFDSKLKEILEAESFALKQAIAPVHFCIPSSLKAATDPLIKDYFLSLGIAGFQFVVGDNKRIWSIRQDSSFQDIFDFVTFQRTHSNYRVIHGPFFNSFLSEKEHVVKQTIFSIASVLSNFHIDAYVTHMGSAKGKTDSETYAILYDSISQILSKVESERPNLTEAPQPVLLLENVVSNTILGDLDFLIDLVKNLDVHFPNKIGICLDTAHAFGRGYNLANKDLTKSFVSRYGKYIKVIHLNDSNASIVKHCGSFKDRHELLGAGLIGSLSRFTDLVFDNPHLSAIVLERNNQILATLDALKLLHSFSLPHNEEYFYSKYSMSNKDGYI